MNDRYLESIREKANALEVSGKLEESLRKWKEIRTIEDSGYAALRHARLARRLKQWGEAEEVALAAMTMFPFDQALDLAQLHIEVGLALLERNDALDGKQEHAQRARIHFQQAIKLVEVPFYYVFVGATYMREGNHALAEHNTPGA